MKMVFFEGGSHKYTKRNQVRRWFKNRRHERFQGTKVQMSRKAPITRWEDTLLWLTQEMIYQVSLRQMKLTGATLKPWKGAWLCILETTDSEGRWWKCSGYSLNKIGAIVNLVEKMAFKKNPWKINRR